MVSKVIHLFVEKNIIPPEDQELYSYGLREGLFSLLNIMTTVVIGWLLGMWWQSLFFLGIFMPLRMNAGGYHTRSHRSCYILSAFITFLSLFLIGQVTWDGIIFFPLLLTSSALVLLMAPMEDENKPLDEGERKRYRKRVWVIIFAYLVLSTWLWLTGKVQIASCFLVAIWLCSMLLAWGFIKERSKSLDI